MTLQKNTRGAFQEISSVGWNIPSLSTTNSHRDHSGIWFLYSHSLQAHYYVDVVTAVNLSDYLFTDKVIAKTVLASSLNTTLDPESHK